MAGPSVLDAGAWAQAWPAASGEAAEVRSFYRSHGKRWFDIFGAVLLLAVCWPVLVAIWLAIRLVDGGPALYRQCRIGRHGQGFEIMKFRTMRAGADRAGTVTIAGDARVTPLGAWLRRYRFDELPQLWNVLRGDMSFVGPRPDVPGYADRLAGSDRAILALRPGVTGPASLQFADEGRLLAAAVDPVAFNDQVLWPAKVRINVDYARSLTFRGDLGWLWRTVLSVAGAAPSAGQALAAPPTSWTRP